MKPPQRDFDDFYLVPFKAAVQRAKVKSLMCSCMFPELHLCRAVSRPPLLRRFGHSVDACDRPCPQTTPRTASQPVLTMEQTM